MKSKSRLRLIVKARDPSAMLAGIRACPPYLPADLWALPGESVQALAQRAVRVATVTGREPAVVVAWVFYPDKARHECRRQGGDRHGSSPGTPHTGTKGPPNRASGSASCLVKVRLNLLVWLR